MHSLTGMGISNVPAFLTKLWQLVEDTSTDEMIAWDVSGQSFHVYDQARFAKEVLPLYFKHKNMASFVRQLNMYGFRKVVTISSGAINSENEDVEFHHPYFIRGEEHLLEVIKRKPSTAGVTSTNVKTEPGLTLNQQDVTRVLNDVQLMKGKQDGMSAKMDKMKKENEALWREVANLRQKHIKQQQIVNKLIQFMVHLVGGNSGMAGAGVQKRKMPLMINDASQVVPSKRTRYNKQLSIEDPQYMVNTSEDVFQIDGGLNSPAMGPVIQEVVDVVDTPSSSTVSLFTPGGAPAYSSVPLLTQIEASPSSSFVDSPLDMAVTYKEKQDDMGASYNSEDLSNLLQVVDPSTSAPTMEDSNSQSSFLDKYLKDHPLSEKSLRPTTNMDDLGNQVERVQDDLESLKDLLSGSQYNFDTNTLFNLFGNDNVPISIENLLGDLSSTDTQSFIPSATETNPNNITGKEMELLPYRSAELALLPSWKLRSELVQFRPSENYLPPVPDLSEIIEEDSTEPLTLPLLSPASHIDTPDVLEEIDPMSFINQNPTKNDHDYTVD
ncbi:heat shock factor protein-like isoform X3 [Mya arenaria]|uniref:heat shock factor protein-like isoform X3 n=1 Tax=Mya arenaria TaxID=6604 RepID=UPI0022E96397|nr:heat shock factor protein-like isoform X3 [Mya arenaria]